MRGSINSSENSRIHRSSVSQGQSVTQQKNIQMHEKRASDLSRRSLSLSEPLNNRKAEKIQKNERKTALDDIASKTFNASKHAYKKNQMSAKALFDSSQKTFKKSVTTAFANGASKQEVEKALSKALGKLPSAIRKDVQESFQQIIEDSRMNVEYGPPPAYSEKDPTAAQDMSNTSSSRTRPGTATQHQKIIDQQRQQKNIANQKALNKMDSTTSKESRKIQLKNLRSEIESAFNVNNQVTLTDEVKQLLNDLSPLTKREADDLAKSMLKTIQDEIRQQMFERPEEAPPPIPSTPVLPTKQDDLAENMPKTIQDPIRKQIPEPPTEAPPPMPPTSVSATIGQQPTASAQATLSADLHASAPTTKVAIPTTVTRQNPLSRDDVLEKATKIIKEAEKDWGQRDQTSEKGLLEKVKSDLQKTGFNNLLLNSSEIAKIKNITLDSPFLIAFIKTDDFIKTSMRREIVYEKFTKIVKEGYTSMFKAQSEDKINALPENKEYVLLPPNKIKEVASNILKEAKGVENFSKLLPITSDELRNLVREYPELEGLFNLLAKNQENLRK